MLTAAWSSAVSKKYSANANISSSLSCFITIDTTLSATPPLPTIAVSGHRELDGVTNITLDHAHAATTVLEHLTELGHREIGVIKGQPLSIDSESRCEGLVEVARQHSIV